MVSKLDYQTCKSEFESHWVPHSVGLVPHWSKELRELQYELSISPLEVDFPVAFRQATWHSCQVIIFVLVNLDLQSHPPGLCLLAGLSWLPSTWGAPFKVCMIPLQDSLVSYSALVGSWRNTNFPVATCHSCWMIRSLLNTWSQGNVPRDFVCFSGLGLLLHVN